MTLIRAASVAAPGHWRGGLYWPAWPTERDVTETQLVELKADTRIVVFDAGLSLQECAATLLAAVARRTAAAAAERAQLLERADYAWERRGRRW